MRRGTSTPCRRAMERQRRRERDRLPDVFVDLYIDTRSFDAAIQYAIEQLLVWRVATLPISRILGVLEPWDRETNAETNAETRARALRRLHTEQATLRRNYFGAMRRIQAAAYEGAFSTLDEDALESNQRRVGAARYEAFGENSYDDGSIGSTYVDGHYTPDAHTMSFTEEEKLAVRAHEPGSIQRERRPRGVFESD